MKTNKTKILKNRISFFKKIHIQTLGGDLLDRLKSAGRSKTFDFIGTIFAILSVIFVTVNNLFFKTIFLIHSFID
jgi:multisubunit Na+/H+ antiporter MnhG subunit